VVSEDIDSRLASMREQILSRSSIQPVVEKFNLYAAQHLSMDDRIDLARKSIDIKPIQSDIARSNGLPGFTIFFTADDPHVAQEVCAEITTLFTGANLRSRAANAEGTTEFLKSQLDSAKRSLDDQDAKLAAFQRQYYGKLPGDEGTNVNMLTTLGTQLETINNKIQTQQQQEAFAQAMLAQQAAGSSASGPGAPAQSSEALQKQLDDLLAAKAELETRYTAENPDVRAINRHIDDVRRQMTQAASAPAPAVTAAAPSHADSVGVQQLRASVHAYDVEIQAERKDQDGIEQQIRSYQGRIQSTPEVEEEYKQLTRDYQSSQTLYDNLLAETQKANEGKDLEVRQEGETFTVLDAANLPDSPFYPKRNVFGMAGLGAGIAIGLLIIALLEYKDTALRSERDIWAFTQLPTLAIIAWSEAVAEVQPGKFARLKRLFSRKAPTEQLADAPG
jgi:polysaccharide chain length determinant protein (PEP-CTERM system associated)